MEQTMTLRELQAVLGERIRIAMDKDLPIEDRLKETEISQTISSMAKQMINLCDVTLRAEKLIGEGKLRNSNIAQMIGRTDGDV